MERMNESHEWDEFSKEFPNSDKHLPPHGEGESMGTQASVALCKLVYKWFNDGDVYDNSYALEGWANDISGSANWLYNHIQETREILKGIEDVEDEDEYTDLLFDLCEVVDPMIPDLLDKPKVGNAYDEKGPFKFKEYVECERCGERFDPDSREWREGDNGMCRDCTEDWEKENEE